MFQVQANYVLFSLSSTQLQFRPRGGGLDDHDLDLHDISPGVGRLDDLDIYLHDFSPGGYGLCSILILT